MPDVSESHPVRSMHEWSFQTSRDYAEPFVDVTVTATFTSPSGTVSQIEAFHDGERTWRVRFNPGEAGRWTFRVGSVPENPDFNTDGLIDVASAETHGFLQSTPGEGWGFAFESGEPVLIFGDTVYHLFGMAHNSQEGAAQVRAFVERRARQGFNLLRVRLPVSYFHPPDGYNVWQTSRLWPWGGSEQMPRFDQFNLDYFRSVDQVMEWAEEFGIGIEMITEGWGNEFPFNSRHIFVAEWEEIWLRYLIARYDAYNAVWFWTLHNEYEYYPNGDWHYSSTNTSCNRWAMRIGHVVRRHAPHGHVIAIHNGPVWPSFGKRFASDPNVIDTVMFQTWGTTDEEHAWLAAGIDEVTSQSLGDWPGSAVLSEWGYEFNPDLPPIMLGHQYCGPEHTRRGAWRGAFSGLGIIHGFENSWGPFQILDEDQPGLVYLLHLRRFLTEIVPFARLRPAHDLASSNDARRGHAPLTLATRDHAVIAVYLPTGGAVTLDCDLTGHSAQWFNPRTAGVSPIAAAGTMNVFSPPRPELSELPKTSEVDRPDDWVLIFRKQVGGLLAEW